MNLFQSKVSIHPLETEKDEGLLSGEDRCLILKALKRVFKLSVEPTGTLLYGGVAQLGEHLPCKQGVDSSILFISTTGENRKRPGDKEQRPVSHGYGLIAQVVRARA